MGEHDFWQAVLYVHLLAMASHYDLFDSSTLQWKLVLVGAVIGLTVVHLRKPKLHALQAAILGLTLVIVWLGLELVVG